MRYFNALPKTFYAFDLNAAAPKAVANIFSRFRFKQEILNNVYAFYKYQIKDGDTPEIVAYKEYGDASYYWIICMVNQLEDPQFDFPLQPDALERKILKQYGYSSIDESFAAIKHYELEVIKTLNEVNGPTTVTTDKSIVTLQQYDYKTHGLVLNVPNSPTTESVVFRANNADPNTAIVANLTVQTTYRPVYVYDYEVELNESKRQIKMLKPEFVEAVSYELKSVLNS